MSDHPTPPFTLDLLPVGDDGAGYRYPQLQKPIKEDTRSGLKFQIYPVCEVHGKLSSQPEGHSATLLVLAFHFGITNSSKRFKKATIQLRFADGLHPHDREFDPVVDGMSPEGYYNINPTSREVHNTATLGVNVWCSTVMGPMMAQPLSLSKATTKKLTDRGLVTGSGNLWRGMGDYNAAIFTLDENPQQEDGIPNILTVALVLKHAPTARTFFMYADVDATAGFLQETKKSLRRFFGGHSEREPFSFCVHKNAEENAEAIKKVQDGKDFAQTIDENALEKLELDEFVEIHANAVHKI